MAHRFTTDLTHLEQVSALFPCRISSYYAGLITAPHDPIWKQCVPSLEECDDTAQLPDPLDEERLSPVPGLIHRYPDRAVLLVSNRCATYCRFCMRKRKVGCSGGEIDLQAACDYIAATPQLRDIILSGGDPLMLPDDELHQILSALRRIPHVEIIRIGSRIPVTDPSRITPALCRMLAEHHPLYLNTHFNHPMELTPEAARACSLLADAGIQLGNQTVLLKGVNDDSQTLQKLLTSLLRLRVRPYYLHQMDLVRGTAHFRTPLQQGRELIGALRGKVSGLAIPHFVIDLPGGKGKVPVLPDSLYRDGYGWQVQTCSGEWVRYADPV
ncbi:MAG: KamA family radical SAM protein [Geobacteraceae bacterium]|nr:KamA family radical SAM protein [Geobacteraceae bacterium]